MNVKTTSIQLWTCPKCKRQFQRQHQSHSCKEFPLALHFEGKPAGKVLFEELKHAVKKQIGPFKIESLECCIHFVSTFTFAAVKIFKDKIQLDFSLTRKINSKRINQFVQLSANRFLYYINISSKDEIDFTLMNWIEEAHNKTSKKAEAI